MEDERATYMILGLMLRIFGAVVCSNKAKELNRSTGGWGFFGFISPIVAMIWIKFMKPIMVWDSNVDLNKPTEKSE
jgi:hypothetical protein